jgi:hypothetical protein
MAQDISLKQMERKAFTSAYQDGLWDIFIGFVLLTWALAPLVTPRLGDFWSSAVLFSTWPFVFLVIWLVRRHVVTPRVGAVRFGSWRTGRMMRFNLVMLVLLSLSAVLGAVLALNSTALPDWLQVVPFSLVVLVIFGVTAYFLDFGRLYLYGLLFALSPLVGRWLRLRWGVAHNGYPLTFGCSAAIAVVIGLYMFARLLREHPLPAQEPPAPGASSD